ncbi:MAG: shikimate dehydrogenase [Lachnospiraceae bacterium]|nr:shikimate dehydrogenase [Lachnospiraceae bacterium]
MLKCGLLGRKLGHSMSPKIHSMLADYSYELFEKEEDEVEAFIKGKEFDGLNVTIPYKKTVFEYMDEVSRVASELGSINTIVKRADGTLYGDNTDVFGFGELVRVSGAKPKGKKALVLGSGGASVSVKYVLEKLGAGIVTISRSGEDNYMNLEKHRDASLIVNTTPVGMFPNVDASPLDPGMFDACEAVIDIIYNPSVTKLMRMAKDAGIPAFNGLYMLVAQAAKSSALFRGIPADDTVIEGIYKKLLNA